MELPAAVADVLRKAQCQDLFVVEGNRLNCILNGHSVPLESVGVIERFVGGKKFKKLASQHKDSQELKKFEPFLTPSTRIKDHLFCALTGQLIKASLEAARKHMKGQRFVKGKERFMEDDMDLLEEPSDETKPARRANHRLQKAESDAELRASEDGDADSSDAMDDSPGANEHDLMDDLLKSDGSLASDEASGSGDEDEEMMQVDAEAPPAAGKRKRAPEKRNKGEGKLKKPKNGAAVDVPLAGLNVNGGNDVPSGPGEQVKVVSKKPPVKKVKRIARKTVPVREKKNAEDAAQAMPAKAGQGSTHVQVEKKGSDSKAKAKPARGQKDGKKQSNGKSKATPGGPADGKRSNGAGKKNTGQALGGKKAKVKGGKGVLVST